MQDWVSSTSATSTSCSHCELHAVSFYLYPHLFPLLHWTFVLSLFPHIYLWVFQPSGFPGGSDGKESACNSGDLGLIPGLEISPGEGNGNPHQYSFFFFFHSNILAQRNSWVEEPRRLQSMGLQTVRYNWVTNALQPSLIKIQVSSPRGQHDGFSSCLYSFCL